MQQPTKKPTKNSHSHKKHKHIHPNNDHPQPPTTTTTTTTTTTANISFQRNTDVKGLKFGGQFIVKSFTVRRSTPLELSLLLNLSPPKSLSSTITFLPSNFTILAHHAWHTLTLGLGTKKSKVIIFVFNNVAAKSEVDLTWPFEIPLGDVNKRLIRGLNGYDLARFKFRKGCITFYVFAVRRCGERMFQCGEDLRCILHSVISLKDFLDHTAMLALPHQRSIDHHSSTNSNNNNNIRPVAAH